MSETKRAKCPGTGQKPSSPPSITNPYPTCPICGKEFSGQGRRYANQPNEWFGVPAHMKTVAAA